MASRVTTETRRRLLIIDDDASLLTLLRIVFETSNYEIVTAHDGLDGFVKARADGFDAILLDLQMPGMDGRSFFRKLRRAGHTTPVLILSAFGAESACHELGAEAFFSKPFDPARLVSVVEDLLSASSSRA
jgi:two-component system, OmpR family, alkaline phosphatase synthesis response regulator PhoP